MKAMFMNRSMTWLVAALLSVTLSACASKSPDGAQSSEVAAPVAEVPSEKVNGQDHQAKDVASDTAKGAADDEGSWDDDSTDDSVVTDPADPWEGFNRAMFSFNDTLDVYFLKPIAKGYKNVTPEFMQTGVSNFFSNIGEISNLTNSGLQGKKNAFVASTWRFVINSTVGIFGLFDVASSLGVRKYDEDFGQTLGYWGVSSGPYLVLPFLGPSTVRDAGGTVVDFFNYDPVDELNLNQDQNYGRWALYVVQKRASFLSAESLIIGDRYSFIRDVYLQNRENEVYDGHPPSKAAKKAHADSWGEDTGTDSWGDDDNTDSWGDDTGTDSWGDPSDDAPAVPESAVTTPVDKDAADTGLEANSTGTKVILKTDDSITDESPDTNAISN